MTGRRHLCVLVAPMGAEDSAAVAGSIAMQLARLGESVLVVDAGTDVGEALSAFGSQVPPEGLSQLDLAASPAWKEVATRVTFGAGRRLDLLRAVGPTQCRSWQEAWRSSYDFVVVHGPAPTSAEDLCFDVVLPVFAGTIDGALETRPLTSLIRRANEARDPDRARILLLPVATHDLDDEGPWPAPIADTLVGVFADWLPMAASTDSAIRQLAVPRSPRGQESTLMSRCRLMARILAGRFENGPELLGLLPPGEFIRDLLGAQLDALERRFENPTVGGLPSGLRDLDRCTDGLQPGQLVVVGGRPGHAKTDLCLKVLGTTLTEVNQPAFFLSLESSALSVMHRLMGSTTRLDSRRVQTAQLDEQAWQRISHGVGRLSESWGYIESRPTVTVRDIATVARRLKENLEALALIIVDPAQAVMSETGDPWADLKRLAMELGVVVIATSRVNRAPERRQDRRPRIADLSGPGRPEDVADLVLMLYRDAVHEPSRANAHVVEIHVAKQRGGRSGQCVAAYYDEASGLVGDQPLGSCSDKA